MNSLPRLQRTAERLAIERAYLPWVHRRKRIPYARILDEALANQSRSLTNLRRLQAVRFEEILRHADAHCPLYRRRFRAAGLNHDELSFARLLDVPFLTKANVAAERAALESSVWRGRKSRAVTSGSTGKALTFYVDSHHEGWVLACQERGQSWWGLRPSDRAVVLWGRPVDGSRVSQWKIAALYRARNRLAFNTFEELSDDFLESIAVAIERFRPRLLYGYGSSLGALARYIQQHHGRVSEEAAPTVVQYTGDHMYEEERSIASEAFAAPVVSVYGSSEGGGTSQPCPEGRSHLSVDHILTEFLRDDGTPADPGESAEIVITTLNNYAMPLIRYRVGDRGRWSDEACACGSVLPWMSLDVGKVADLIRTSARERVSPYFLDYLNKHLRRTESRGIAQFLVEQVALDRFVLNVVKERPFDSASVEFFTDNMRSHLGEQIEIDVRFVDQIPVSASGKRRWFAKSPELEAV